MQSVPFPSRHQGAVWLLIDSLIHMSKIAYIVSINKQGRQSLQLAKGDDVRGIPALRTSCHFEH